MDINLLKGIGPKTLKILNNLGVYTIEDLVNYYPYRYDHYTIGDLNNISNKTLVKAKVLSSPVVNFIKKNFNKLSFNVEVDNKIVKVIIFNRHFLKNNLTLNKDIFITGKYDEKNNTISPEEVMPGSNKKVWWKCKLCGHEWEAVINNRNRGTGCPNCRKNKI